MKSAFTVAVVISAALLQSSCAQAGAPSVENPSSILARSTPAAGSTVRGPIDSLELHFSPPARLDEVIVSGTSGAMPMMVHAVGEVADYSLPLSGIEAGIYTVSWRATAQGREQRGSYQFTVR
jgi:methionine-rich copper-binding protein CopC